MSDGGKAGGWLSRFRQQRDNALPVTVVGAAVFDLVARADGLPPRGGDLPVDYQGTHLGGCALNIVLALQRLGVACEALLPVGEGMWADRLRVEMARLGVRSRIQVAGEDNGWCLALVEPDGERTFITLDGVENRWRREWLEPLTPAAGLAYFSGYQLAAPGGGALIAWLEALPAAVVPVLDFGPRLDRMSDALLQRLIRPGVILTLNEREAGLLGMGADVAAFCRELWQRTGQLVVVRQGERGCYYFRAEDDAGQLAAYPTHVVDTIGAGDSHCAGLMAGLARGLTARESLTLAGVVSAYVVAHRGGDCAPDLAQLTAFAAG